MVYLFFDTETTGLPKNKQYNAPSSNLDVWDSCRLDQISWIMQSDKRPKEVLAKGDFIIRPEGFEIPKESSDVHGITTERALAEGEDLKKVMYYFLGAAKLADVIVGHNVSYDMHVAGAELIRTWGKDYIQDLKTEDTMLSSIEFCAIPSPYGNGFKYPKLIELYKKLFNKEFEDAHNSMADITATAKCYWALKKKKIL